jgi:hypothetical protein
LGMEGGESRIAGEPFLHGAPSEIIVAGLEQKARNNKGFMDFYFISKSYKTSI